MKGPIPLLVVTGFSGAGKSTLIARWLADPEFAQARVLADEQLPAGADRAQFASSLRAILEEASARGAAPLTRVMVETSGFADPVPMLRELTVNEWLHEHFRLEGVIAVVDALEGERTLQAHRSAMAQAVVADALVIAKTDLVPGLMLDRLEARLGELNPHAALTRSFDGNAVAQLVMAGVAASAGREARYSRAAAIAPAIGDDEVRSVAIPPGAPIDAEELRSNIESFLEQHGASVIRMKGMVAIAGRPGPAIVQVVAGVLYPVRLLARWPQGATPGITLVTQGLPEPKAEALFGAPLIPSESSRP